MRSKVILAEQEVDPHCAGMELGVYARQHLGISNRRLQKAVRTRASCSTGALPTVRGNCALVIGCRWPCPPRSR